MGLQTLFYFLFGWAALAQLYSDHQYIVDFPLQYNQYSVACLCIGHYS